MTRAIRTANIALEACERNWIPVKRHWRLNERHYGGLQGKDKKATLEEYGEEQFMLWRRSYDVPPPPIELGSEWDQSSDLRYAHLTPDLVPRTECLKDVVHRHAALLVRRHRARPAGRRDGPGRRARQLAARAGRPPRRAVGASEVVGLNIPTGQPLRYDLDDAMHPTNPGGTYLDESAAKAAAEAVAAQGR